MRRCTQPRADAAVLASLLFCVLKGLEPSRAGEISVRRRAFGLADRQRSAVSETVSVLNRLGYPALALFIALNCATGRSCYADVTDAHGPHLDAGDDGVSVAACEERLAVRELQSDRR